MLFFLRFLLLSILTILSLPFLAALWLILLLLNLIEASVRLVKRPMPDESRPLSGLVSIVILNWNGEDLLAEGIPSVLKAVQTDGRPHEILVVDNGSTDGSIEYLEKHFPEVRLLALDKNLGFAGGNNAGVRAASHDVVVLLNNDMIVDPGFLQPLLSGFGPKTFAVSSQIHHQDLSQRREETGRTTAVFRRGMLDYSHREIDPSSPKNYYTILWAGGGSSAFHRDKFLALGGFHELYSPAYVEDADLSYAAWRAGWEVLLAPASVVYHKHRASTSRRFSPSRLQVLVARNQFLFIWKNIRSWRFLLSHGIWLPWNCYRLTRDHGLIAWLSLLQAAGSIPAIAAARFRTAIPAARSDGEIFARFSKPGHYSQMRRLSSSGDRPRILWATAYLPHMGRHAGAGRMFQLLKRLSAGYRITLLSFLEAEDEREFLPAIAPFCERIIALNRSRARRWQLFAYEPFDEFLRPEMVQAFDCALEDHDFDLIQLEYTQMACYARRVRGVPVLLTKHEVDFAACARRARQERAPVGKLRWFYNYLQVLDREIKLTKDINGIICMTDKDALELRKFSPPVPTYVVNTGVDLDYFIPPARPASESRLIFVGAFQHFPNVDSMIFFCREVLPIVRDKVPGIEMLIVGSTPAPQVLSLATIPGVQVTGYVPDIRPFMAGSSIYVVPLRLGVGIRGKILEAWGMGMAVVSTSVGCAGLRYENGRNLLLADTPGHFASQIVSLIKDPRQRRSLGEEGRKTAEQYYSWERSAAQLDSLYRHFIAQDGVHKGSAASELSEIEFTARKL